MLPHSKPTTTPTTKRAIIAWGLFDWANSAFPTIITTFVFASYFTEKIAVDKITGTALWGDAQVIAGLVIALLSPILGAIADHEGRRKPWLALFTLLCIIAAAALWYAKPEPDYIHWTLTWLVIGTIGLEIGMVFYNAMLNDLAPPDYIGRFSGWSWGFGYLGGLTCLIIALFGFIQGGAHWLNLDHDTYEQVRICGPLVALWFLVFGWPLFVFTPDRPSSGLGMGKAVKKGLLSLRNTLRYLWHEKQILKFLLARMIYIDGLNTIFAFGGIYAAGTFGMDFSEIILFGIAMNVAAGLGAGFFAWMDDFKGSKLTLLITLSMMISFGGAMLIVKAKLWFWLFGMGLSLCVGPVQAASRSLLIRLAPKEVITELFGLYAFSGKATAFIGPLVLASITLWMNSQRWGMATPLLFLGAGALLLARVNTKQKGSVNKFVGVTTASSKI